MWRTMLVLFLTSAAPLAARGQDRFVRLEVASHFLPTNRTVRICLPPSYADNPQRRYPVLYLHDGQNVFSPAGTNVAFGWGNWELDKTADELCRAGRMREVIMVAVANSPARYAEYCGRSHDPSTNANTPFDNYAAFLIRELKPKMDLEYRTRPEATNTGVMGSSLGGTCSIVLAWDHPEVFGLAASLSGAFQVEQTNFLHHTVSEYQGSAKPTRLYLDSGSVDFAGGDDGRSLTIALAAQFRRLGWGRELMLFTDEKPLTLVELEKTTLRRDKWPEAQTSQHNEFYWRLRVWRALTFLFPPPANSRQSAGSQVQPQPRQDALHK